MYPILFIIVVIVITAIAVLGYHQHLKSKARKCAKEAQIFHQKLQQLSSTSHFFTDEELHDLKMEFYPLLETVNNLYDSHFISRKYLDDLNLDDFIEERRLLNHTQYINNQSFKSN